MARLSDVVDNLKRTGPRTDPVVLRMEYISGISVNQICSFISYQFDRYELHHRRAVPQSKPMSMNASS